MAVTAKQLSKSGARGKELDALIHDQLQLIDDRLQRADKTWGRNVLQYELPTSFSLPGLEKKDAQRLVYAAIIKSLKERELEVRLTMEASPERTVLYIAWMTDLSTAEIEAMNALIQSVRINPQDVPAFIQRGALPAPRSATAARQGRAAAAPPMTVVEDRVMQPRGGARPSAAAEARRAAAAAGAAATEAHLSAAEAEILRGE